MEIQAYLFDMDGTFLDTEPLWAQAMAALVCENGGSCTKEEMLKIVFGRSWRDIYVEMMEMAPGLVKRPIEESALRAREHFNRLAESESIVIEASAALLRRLAREKPVAVVSGSPHDDVEEGVKLINADGLVRFVLGAEDYARGKPAPDGFLKAAELLGVEPGACVVFEDSPAGVAAARAAGMLCVGLARYPAAEEAVAQAHWVVRSLAEYSDEALLKQSVK